jgi:phage baseplate assembly protein W
MAVDRGDLYTSVKKKSEIYSDFFADLTPHPDTGEIVRAVNETAVSRSIRNIILTNRYDRVMNPTLGSGIQSLLFEPMNSATTDAIRSAIITAINNHEPRARVERVIVEENEQFQYYRVTVIFFIINNETPFTTNVTLQRVR